MSAATDDEFPLVATYSALGTRDGDEYFRGDECLACIKDLIRALRADNDKCEVRIRLGKAQVLQKDLMALLVHYADDTRLRNDVIRLLVNLTQPAYLCLGEQYPGSRDTEGMKCMMEINRHLREYKEEFAVERVMNTLGTVLAELCQKDWDDRDDDDVVIIERILLLIRNVLHVSPAPEEEKRTDDDVSVHDQIIWNLHINGIDELLLFLGSNPNETEWCMHILEIVFLMLRQQSPSNLARAGRSHTHQEKKKEEERIEELLLRENTQRHKRNVQRGSRHSNFGGSFVVTEQLTISGKGRVHHKPLAAIDSYSQDVEKRPRRTPKNKKIAPDPPRERLSTYSIRLVLKEFCIQLLECCFNVLMRVVKDNINRLKAMDNDETYYLWAMRFFMEFSRLHNFRVDIVSETLQLSILHYVLQLMVNYYENMVMHKRERHDALAWSQRLHYAVQAYKELLIYIQTMTKSNDPSIVESSKVILSNILYHPEYREIFVTLLRNHYEMFQPMRFVHDVIEMTHTYLSLMEHYSKTNGGMLIQKRRKVSKRKKKSLVEVTEVLTEEQVLAKWEEVKDELESVLMRDEFTDELPVPFDPLSERSGDEQKQVAMTNVYKMLCNGRPNSAIAWMRASREMWPDDVFGSDGMTSSQELETLRELLMNPLSSVPLTRHIEEEHNRPDDEEEEAESQEPIFHSYELEFDMKKYTELFANNKILRVYSLALAGYRDNSDQLNHAIVKMLHRIAVRHNMAAMLFQVSVFRILSNILNESPLPRYKELQKFCRYLVSRFFTMARTNPLMFAELLIWKTSSSCYELTMGYGTLEREREQRRNRAVWTREQEEELRALYEEFKNETDIVGCIEAALPSDHLRTRKIIASQLVSMGLVESRQALNKKKHKGAWSDEDLFTLQSVFQYQENEKEAVQHVAQYFPGRSLRDIRQQLVTLGLLTATTKSARKRTARTPESDMDMDLMMEEGGELTPPTVSSTVTSQQYTNVGNIRSLVRSLHRDGLSEQLSWLEVYLSDEAQDREVDDEWEEMCIVAMEKDVSDALDRQDFKDLMGSLGLTPPNAQEVYWRIPATTSPASLREMAAKLQYRGEGHSSPVVEREDATAMRRLEDSSDDDDDVHKLTIVASPDNDDQLSNHSDQSNHQSDDSNHCSDQSNHHSDYSSDEELSKDGALAMLKKRRRRQDGSHSSPPCKVVAKKPRLATRSQFLSDESEDDTDDDCSSQQSREDVAARHGRITRLDSDDDSDGSHDNSQTVSNDHVTRELTESSFHLEVTQTVDTEEN